MWQLLRGKSVMDGQTASESGGDKKEKKKFFHCFFCLWRSVWQGLSAASALETDCKLSWTCERCDHITDHGIDREWQMPCASSCLFWESDGLVVFSAHKDDFSSPSVYEKEISRANKAFRAAGMSSLKINWRYIRRTLVDLNDTIVWNNFSVNREQTPWG